jgi:hypothetical protein
VAKEKCGVCLVVPWAQKTQITHIFISTQNIIKHKRKHENKIQIPN